MNIEEGQEQLDDLLASLLKKKVRHIETEEIYFVQDIFITPDHTNKTKMQAFWTHLESSKDYGKAIVPFSLKKETDLSIGLLCKKEDTGNVEYLPYDMVEEDDHDT